MNKPLTHTTLFILFVTLHCFSQVDDSSLPLSLEKKTISTQLTEDKVIELITPNIGELKAQDEVKTIPGVPNRVGINLPASLDLKSDGNWSYLSNGDKLCRLRIHMKNARAIGLYFEKNVLIPEGATLHIFDPEGKKVLGAFTSKNDGFKAMEMIPGEDLILEYLEPKGVNHDPIINIKEAVFFYKEVIFEDASEVNQEKVLDCQVDVMCSEGTSWSDQRRAVVYYTYPVGAATGSCSAVLANNTAQDCTPYLLSASHCGLADINTDISGWVWYWNYEKATCEPGTGNQSSFALPSTTLTGGVVKASALNGSLDNGYGVPELQGTDFLLIELNQRPPQTYNVYYAGWDKGSATAVSGVLIHHPSGGPKKIATSSQIFSLDNLFWGSQWAATPNGLGLPEIGSSGAPLFNQSGQIVGLASFSTNNPCSIDQVDGFGKFSRSWSSNGVSPQQRLSDWLDPTNSNTNSLSGRENNCTSASVQQVILPYLNVFPNPAEDDLFLNFSHWTKLTVIDVFGKEVAFRYKHPCDCVNLPELSSGYYILKVDLNDGNEALFKIIKQ